MKSPRNNTLTLSKKEISQLDNQILSLNDLKEKFDDNTIVNGNLLDCLDYIPNNYFDLIINAKKYSLAFFSIYTLVTEIRDTSPIYSEPD